MEQFSGETGIVKILEALPHRYPFLLVDRVLRIERNPPGSKDHVGEQITTLKNVTVNEPFFQGHFPGNPIMPGVLMIEAMAQSSALLAIREHPTGGKWQFFIVGCDKTRFRQTVVPGDSLEMTCKVIRQRSSMYVFDCRARVQGQLVCEAEIMAKMF